MYSIGTGIIQMFDISKSEYLLEALCGEVEINRLLATSFAAPGIHSSGASHDSLVFYKSGRFELGSFPRSSFL